MLDYPGDSATSDEDEHEGSGISDYPVLDYPVDERLLPSSQQSALDCRREPLYRRISCRSRHS